MLDWSKTKYVDEDNYIERIKRHTPVTGDVLYSREGERFGLAALTPKETTLCLGQRMMLFQARQGVATSYFLWALLNSKGVYNQAEKCVGGATSPHVNIRDIKMFKVFEPPMNQQLSFNLIVEKLNQKRARIESSLIGCDDMFSSLTQRAFRGEL